MKKKSAHEQRTALVISYIYKYPAENEDLSTVFSLALFFLGCVYEEVLSTCTVIYTETGTWLLFHLH